jgi:hypothetical protein
MAKKKEKAALEAAKPDPKAAAKQSSRDKARATMGLPPIEHAPKSKTPREPGVVTKRKSKFQVLGYASLPVIHAMGAAGWEFEPARAALAKLCPETKNITDENLRYRLNIGKAGKRSRPAPLTEEEWAALTKAAGAKSKKAVAK